jgi:Flp pilus assembly protein TadG
MTRTPRSTQRGVFTVITAIASVLLVLLLALVIDLSRILIIKGELQTMADACALAAVAELNSRSSNTVSSDRAKINGVKVTQFSKKNLQAESADTVVVSTTVPNTLRPNAAKSASCTVISQNNFFYFLDIFGYEFGEIKAVATAGLKPTIKACVLPIALLKLSSGNDYLVTTSSTDIKNNLRFADLREDRSESIDFTTHVQDYGLCNVTTKYRDVFSDLNSNTNVINALHARRLDAISYPNANRLYLSVPVVSSIVTADSSIPNARMEKWVCLEMNNSNTNIAYVGLVGSSASPCISMGITGTGVDAVGPLAPVLTK